MNASENGWSPAKARPDQCVWVTVPGTTVSLQLLQGQPMAIMRAFAADFNAYVEPLRDADSAGWTPTNSVATSNHLNGTAMDLNWNSHPFRILNAGFTSKQINTIRDMLDFYEDTIWWGNDWNEPRDAMHFQMGYDSYNNPRTADFIARKIRADGYSTFRRDGGQPALSKSDRYALAIIGEGQRRGITPRGIQIALATALVESNLTMYANSSVPESLALPHDAVGSDYDSLGLFQQRCPMWGPADVLMDPTQSAGLFYDHLARLDYNGPDSPGSYAQAVQVSAFPDRYDQRFGDAVALYDRLSTVTQEDDFMSALSDAEQREMLDLLRQQSGYRRVSRSPLRHVGEGPTETATGFELNVDGSVHTILIYLLARHLGDPDAIALLREVASLNTAQFPDRVHDKQLAQAILNDIAGQATAESAPPTGQTPGVVPTPISVPPTPVVVPPAPIQVPPTPPAVPPSGGGISSGVNAVDTDLATLRAVLADLTQQIRS